MFASANTRSEFPNLGNPPSLATMDLVEASYASPNPSRAARTSTSATVRRANPPQQDPQMLDVNQVADRLTCSPRTVYRQVDMGRMPAPVRIGRLVRWSSDAIDEWVARGCPDPRQRKASSHSRQTGSVR